MLGKESNCRTNTIKIWRCKYMKLSQEEITLKANELKRSYLKEWRAANKEKSKQYKENYWTKKVLEANASQV